MQVFLRPDIQQPGLDIGVQEQRRMRHQQEEPDLLQGLPTAEVLTSGDVQERLALRPQVQLVQDPLPPPGAGGVLQVGRGQQQLREGGQVADVEAATPASATALRLPATIASAILAQATPAPSAATAQLFGRPQGAGSRTGHPDGPVQQETAGTERRGDRRNEKDSFRSNVCENLVVVFYCFSSSLFFFLVQFICRTLAQTYSHSSDSVNARVKNGLTHMRTKCEMSHCNSSKETVIIWYCKFQGYPGTNGYIFVHSKWNQNGNGT